MFTNEMSWADWVYAATKHSGDLRKTLQNALMFQKKFYDMTYGLSDAQILALPLFAGKDQTHLNALRTTLNTLKDMHDGFFGLAALAQVDRSASCVKMIE